MSSSPPAPSPVPDDLAGRLRAELAEARARHDELEREHEQLLADSAVIQEDRDASAQVLAGAHGAMTTAQRAVARLDDGTYGSCEACGAQIPPERLEAMPSALHCVDCSA